MVPPGDLHQDLLSYDCFRELTSLPAHYPNWQPAAIPAPGKQTCKGKRCEGKEQTSPGVRGHMALPHVTEGLCKRTSSQGDSVCPAFSFKPTQQEEGAFPCKPSSYLGWLPVLLEPLSFVHLQPSNSCRTMAECGCVHSALPAQPAPARCARTRC